MRFDYREALIRTASALLDQGSTSEALFHLQRLAANFPSADAFWRLGNGLVRGNAFEQARQAFEQALSLDPKHARSCIALAHLRQQEGRKAAALDLLRHYLSHQEDVEIRAELDRLQQIPRAKESTVKGVAVFVSDDPRVRHAKLAFGLRTAGWKVILLHHLTPNYALTDYFDEAYRYASIPEALKLASRHGAQVYHVFSIWGDMTSVRMIQHKPGKTVYDYWDIVEGIKAGAGLVPLQRYCIENADGLCCRDLRAQYLINALGYKGPSKTVVLPDCCWNRLDESLGPSAPVNGEIHAVACGYIGIEKLGETDNGYLDIARLFAAQHVHLHVYPHPSQTPFEDKLSDYLKLAERTPFFHLHRPIPMDSVIPELAKYQVGVTITRSLTYGSTLTGYEPWYLHHCGSARLFDYLDAGLPVMLNKALAFQFSLLSPHGLALDATPEILQQARMHLERLLSPDIRERVKQVREVYSIQSRIGQLIDLYERL